jgi:hypothetical protein
MYVSALRTEKKGHRGQLQQMGLNKPGTSLAPSPDQQRSDVIIANAIFPLTTNEFKSRAELVLF